MGKGETYSKLNMQGWFENRRRSYQTGKKVQAMRTPSQENKKGRELVLEIGQERHLEGIGQAREWVDLGEKEERKSLGAWG